MSKMGLTPWTTKKQRLFGQKKYGVLSTQTQLHTICTKDAEFVCKVFGFFAFSPVKNKRTPKAIQKTQKLVQGKQKKASKKPLFLCLSKITFTPNHPNFFPQTHPQGSNTKINETHSQRKRPIRDCSVCLRFGYPGTCPSRTK